MRSMRNDIQYPRGIERTYARIAPRIISNYFHRCNFAGVKLRNLISIEVVNYDVSS
ncbi:MAG: hypothetical protein QOK62_06685 [Nitrososphaeraceae archaeon]|nr:hypothetical protein [Nitrososphaeraceae archaeon]